MSRIPMILKKVIMTALTTLGLVCISTAEANMISGQLWRVLDNDPDSPARHATLQNVPARTPDVTFDVDSTGLHFDSGPDDHGVPKDPYKYTVEGWLMNPGGATNIVYTPGGELGPTDPLGNYQDRYGSNQYGVLVEFTGFVSVTDGKTIFSVSHDDGMTLIIGDEPYQWTLASPDRTEVEVTTGTYNGPSGNQPFKLIYAECCTAPAVLEVGLPFSPTPVPEPATLTLMSLGLTGIGVVRHRRRRG